jgi:3-oxoadipate enol-lactonase
VSHAPPLHHLVDGPADAPPLLLANSLGSTLAMWEPNLPALTERFRVIRFDLRGHGATPATPGPYSMGELGSDLVRLLDGLNVQRAHVAGVSLGAMMAIWMAANAGGRVDRLVLCSTSARLGPPENWAARADRVLAGDLPQVAVEVVTRWFTPGYAERNPDVVARMRSDFAACDPVGYAGCCRAIETMDLCDDLTRITAPTLVVVGRNDPATPPDHAERIAAGIADSRLVVVEGAAHLATWEQAKTCTELIIGHLEGVAA